MPTKPAVKNWDSHYILYAKGHYHRTDVIEDLKVIHARWAGIYIEHATLYDIYRVLLEIARKHGLVANEFAFNRFMENISPDCCKYVGYPTDKAYDYYLAVIYACLSHLKLIRVWAGNTELVPLDEPDETLLPLTRKN